jgi:hypothetical protein
MATQLVERDDQYILNQCTKYLARDNADHRHDFGQYDAGDGRGRIAEAWRFPIVDSHWDGGPAAQSYTYNAVTFIYAGGPPDGAPPGGGTSPGAVSVVGTFGDLWSPVPLRPLRFLGTDTGLFAVTVRVPKGQVHRYKFLVDGRYTLDPVNPQRIVLDNGEVWSRLFTDACQIPLELDRRERRLLDRLVAHLLPFRLDENRAFVRTVYDRLDRGTRTRQFPLAYRLDEQVGVVNYIDKLISRAERHNAYAYHTCLDIVEDVLRARSGGADPAQLPPDFYADLYNEMADDRVDGWDYGRYNSPRYFLLLLRRHAITGAFVHPRHGGNSGTAGWIYLEDRYTNASDQTLFDWRRAIEQPLGDNTEYRG